MGNDDNRPAGKGDASKREAIQPGFLKTAWKDSNEYVAISRSNLDTFRTLLEKAYADLYAPVFPLDHGGESLDSWLKVLEDPRYDADYRIIIAGQNLSANDGPATPKAMAVSIYYHSSDTGLLAYIVTDRKFRNEGLGKKVYTLQAEFLHAAAQEHGNPLRGWFIECYDPTKTNENYDNYSSQKLVDKYVSWGARQVPIDYNVPDTFDKNIRIDIYMLLSGAHPETSSYPGDDVVLDYVESIYRSLGIPDPVHDHEFKSIKEQLARSKNPDSPKGPELNP